MTDVQPSTCVPKSTLLTTHVEAEQKAEAPTPASPRKEIARIGRNENETNVSIAAFTILPIVHDDEPTSRRGR